MQFDDSLTSEVKKLAKQCGFARVGIAPVGVIGHGGIFKTWLAAGFHAEMEYMSNNVEKRLHPEELVEDAQCVICLAVSYARYDDDIYDTNAYIARYARGRDYHKLLKKRAIALCGRIREIFPNFVGRCFVDTAPLAERELAAQSGLGWIGRNGMLVVPGLGNNVNLAEIVCNLPLRGGTARPSGCGDCAACVAACPTNAILPDKTIDCNRCLSYHTIENRGKIPRELWAKLGNRVFGCDSCQNICPHARKAPPGDEQLTTAPENSVLPMSIKKILRWTYDDWDAATRGSAMRRVTHEMFIRNALIAAGNSKNKNPSLCDVISNLRSQDKEFAKNLADEIGWALGEIND